MKRRLSRTLAKVLVVVSFVVAIVELLLTLVTLGLYDRIWRREVLIGHTKCKDNLSIRLLRLSTRFY